MSNQWGGGMHSEGPGGFWPYIGVDRAVSHILRGEPDRALDYFCAYTDTAGGTLSWGEGYANLIAGGDQPHFWADAQWVNLFRQLFAFEDGSSLWLTPALFRRWHAGDSRVRPPSRGCRRTSARSTCEFAPQRDRQTIRYTVRLIAPERPGARSWKGSSSIRGSGRPGHPPRDPRRSTARVVQPRCRRHRQATTRSIDAVARRGPHRGERVSRSASREQQQAQELIP